MKHRVNPMVIATLFYCIFVAQCDEINRHHQLLERNEHSKGVEYQKNIAPVNQYRIRKREIVIQNAAEGLSRFKRQSELMDLENGKDGTTEETPQDEGFWSRVARVALNILKRFMQWLNE